MFQYLKSFSLALLLSVGLGSVGKAASFDCNKATTETEIAICGDPELSALDELMGFTYRQYLTYESWLSFEKDKSKIIQIQRDWINQRNKCQSNTFCLFKHYQRQIFFLFDEINDDDSVIVGLRSPGNLDVNNIQYLSKTFAVFKLCDLNGLSMFLNKKSILKRIDCSNFNKTLISIRNNHIF